MNDGRHDASTHDRPFGSLEGLGTRRARVLPQDQNELRKWPALRRLNNRSQTAPGSGATVGIMYPGYLPTRTHPRE